MKVTNKRQGWCKEGTDNVWRLHKTEIDGVTVVYIVSALVRLRGSSPQLRQDGQTNLCGDLTLTAVLVVHRKMHRKSARHPDTGLPGVGARGWCMSFSRTVGAANC